MSIIPVLSNCTAITTRSLLSLIYVNYWSCKDPHLHQPAHSHKTTQRTKPTKIEKCIAHSTNGVYTAMIGSRQLGRRWAGVDKSAPSASVQETVYS